MIGLGKLTDLRLALTALACAAVLAMMPGMAAAQQGPVIYAIVNEQDAEALAALFHEITGLSPQILSASTGEIIARVQAEAGNPQADIVLGGPSTLHITLKDTGALAPHTHPEGLEPAPGAFDPEGYWTGFHTTALGLGINTQRFASRYPDRDYPATWEDLLDPAFNGEIVATDPVASSTAYLFVQAQLQRLGWDAGWEYLEQLAALVGQFPASGGAPTQLVAAGEYTIGISYVHPLAREIAAGRPLAVVVPPGTGGDIGAISVIAGGPNPEAAQAFVDFVLGVEAQQLFTERTYTSPLHPDVVLPDGVLNLADIELIDYDPELAAAQRDEVLNKWSELVD